MASESHPVQPKPGSINALLSRRASAGAAPGQAPAAASVPSGTPMRVELDKLDRNPFQHRTHMDEGKLAELMAGIAQKGLIEPVVIRPVGDRYQLIAGHRRAEAFRRLRDRAEGSERDRWTSIQATLLQVSDEDMALIALQENLQREDPNAVDLGDGIALVQQQFNLTTEQVAEKLGLDLRRVQRLLQLQGAPEVLKTSVSKGLLVDLEPEEGKEARREHRKVEYLAALESLKLFKHLTKKKGLEPKKAEERLEAFLHRAAKQGWGFRKVATEIERAIKGREGEGVEKKAEALPLFKKGDTSLLVHFDRLAEAPAKERSELKEHLKSLLAQLD